MALTFTSWTEYTDDASNARTLTWPPRTGSSDIYPALEALRQAVVERGWGCGLFYSYFSYPKTFITTPLRVGALNEGAKLLSEINHLIEFYLGAYLKDPIYTGYSFNTWTKSDMESFLGESWPTLREYPGTGTDSPALPGDIVDGRILDFYKRVLDQLYITEQEYYLGNHSIQAHNYSKWYNSLISFADAWANASAAAWSGPSSFAYGAGNYATKSGPQGTPPFVYYYATLDHKIQQVNIDRYEVPEADRAACTSEIYWYAEPVGTWDANGQAGLVTTEFFKLQEATLDRGETTKTLDWWPVSDHTTMSDPAEPADPVAPAEDSARGWQLHGQLYDTPRVVFNFNVTDGFIFLS